MRGVQHTLLIPSTSRARLWHTEDGRAVSSRPGHKQNRLGRWADGWKISTLFWVAVADGEEVLPVDVVVDDFGSVDR